MAAILETPIKSPQEPQAMMAQECPSCGNIFKEDSVFCRKCGFKRPAATQGMAAADTPPGGEHHASPFSWIRQRLHLGDSAKRARHYESDFQRRLATVADAASGNAEEAEADVLKAMCMALACPKAERNSFENESVGILGEVMNMKKASMEEDAKEKGVRHSQAQTQAKTQEAKLQQAKQAVRNAKDGQVAIKKSVEVARAKLENKSSELRQAQIALSTEEAALKAAQHEKEQVEELYKSHFFPLKNGTAGSKHAEDRLLKGLLPHLQTWGCEDCLLAGFTPAVRHQPIERGDWCSRVVDAVEELFAKPRQDADKRVADAQSRKAMAEKALQKLTGERESLEKDLAAATEKEVAAANTVADMEKAEAKAAGDALEAQGQLSTLEEELESATSAVQAFSDGPLADFQWLTGHSELAGRELRGNAEHKLHALLNVTPHHLPGSLDAAGSARAKKVIHKLNDPDFADNDVPAATLTMLSDFAGGAVGPSPNQRSRAQIAAAEMIKKGLKSRQNQLLSKIDKQGGTLFEADKVKQFQGKDGKRLIGEEADRKSKALTAAEASQKIVCGAPVAEAEAAEKEAQRNYDELAKKATQSENIFKQHFLPLKDGTSQSAHRDLDICMSFLKGNNCEDCLMAGFTPAAGHKPAERGTWCTKVVEEVEKLIQKSVKDAQMEREKAAQILAAKKAATKAAKARCAEAQEHSQQAKTAYDELMELVKYVTDLDHLRTEMAHLLEGC